MLSFLNLISFSYASSLTLCEKKTIETFVLVFVHKASSRFLFIEAIISHLKCIFSLKPNYFVSLRIKALISFLQSCFRELSVNVKTGGQRILTWMTLLFMKSHKSGWNKEIFWSRINFFSSDLNNRTRVFSLLRQHKIAVNTYRYSVWKSCLLNSSPTSSRLGYPNEKEKQAR